MRTSMRVGAATVAVLVAACTGAGGVSGDRPDGPAVADTSGDAPVQVRSAPLPDRSPFEAARLDPFDAARALSVATEITALGPRPAGGPGDVAARDLVAQLLTDAGWTVEHRPFPLPQGGTSANVVAWLPQHPPDGSHVVLGAHLDTVAGSPGANDNASGIGVVVALAEELADEPSAVPVVLVAFGAEEYQPSEPREHHIGSQRYAEEHAGSVVAALSVDMVGNGEVTCICWFPVGPDTLARRLEAIAPDLGYEVRARGDISDHGPFARRGIPAALLWTGRDGRYHSPADTADHLRLDDLRRAGDLALAFVRGLRPEDHASLVPR